MPSCIETSSPKLSALLLRCLIYEADFLLSQGETIVSAIGIDIRYGSVLYIFFQSVGTHSVS